MIQHIYWVIFLFESTIISVLFNWKVCELIDSSLVYKNFDSEVNELSLNCAKYGSCV